MSLSSTSNFRAWLSLLACLCLVEIALRLPAVQDRLPLPVPYYDRGVEVRRRALQRLQRQGIEPEVLFIGSSIVRTNLNPRVFDQTRGRGTSFNGGLSGLPPDCVRLYYRHFWSLQAHPRVVVQGIRLAEVQRPQPAEKFERFHKARLESMWLAGESWDSYLVQHCRLLYHAGSLSDALLNQGEPDEAIDEQGYEGLTRTLQGRPAADSKFDPEAAALTFQSIAACAAECQSQGISYLLLNVPEHPDRYPAAVYRAYLERMAELCRQSGIACLDPCPDNVPAEGFADDHHMNQTGARLFTQAVAEQFRRAGATF